MGSKMLNSYDVPTHLWSIQTECSIHRSKSLLFGLLNLMLFFFLENRNKHFWSFWAWDLHAGMCVLVFCHGVIDDWYCCDLRICWQFQICKLNVLLATPPSREKESTLGMCYFHNNPGKCTHTHTHTHAHIHALTQLHARMLKWYPHQEQFGTGVGSSRRGSSLRSFAAETGKSCSNRLTRGKKCTTHIFYFYRVWNIIYAHSPV